MPRLAEITISDTFWKGVWIFLLIENSLSIAVGLTINIMAIYITVIVESKATFLNPFYDKHSIPTVLSLTGSSIIATSIYGIIICFKSRKNVKEGLDAEIQSKYSTVVYVYFWLNFLILMFLFISGITLSVQARNLKKAFNDGFRNAMLNYLEDVEVKKQVDYVQTRYHCCGVKNYKDWFEVKWERKLSHSPAMPNQKENLYADDVPFSCCNIYTMSPCISEHIESALFHYGYDYTENLTLYTSGCANVLSNYYGEKLLKGTAIFIMTTLFMQVITTILTRYLQTSLKSMLSKEDPVKGWLLDYNFKLKKFKKKTKNKKDVPENRMMKMKTNEDKGDSGN